MNWSELHSSRIPSLAMTPPEIPPALSALTALLAPLLLLGTLLWPRAGKWGSGRLVAEAGARLASAALVFASLALLAVWIGGPVHHRLQVAGPLALSLRLDALSALMLVLVSFLGAVVTRYSVNYLDGDQGHARFARGLALTIAAVQLLVLSGNLAQFALCWVGTSLALHQLLTFYPDRQEARAAAAKKFVISRLADACVILASVLIWRQFGTLEFDALFEAASNLTGQPAPGLGPIALLLVSAALLKSAQFPFHSWLPESLESPTPVSALMHAGIINAGGFLIIRLAPLVSLAPSALNLLAIVGATSAVLASLVMMTQTSIKRSLAWSTVSQMGFMMLQCGLGAFALATLHIIAHSLYKAYAFLSSGSVVAIARSAWSPSGRPSAHPAVLFFVLSVALSLTLSIGMLFGEGNAADPGMLVLSSIFVMALAFMLWNLWSTRFPSRLATWGILLALGTVLAWFTAHDLIARLLGSSLPPYNPERSTAELVVMAGVVALFMTLLVFQACLPSLATRPLVRRLYVHASNGFYVGLLARRATAALVPSLSQPTSSHNRP